MEEIKELFGRAQVMNSMITRELSDINYDATPAALEAKLQFISNLCDTLEGLVHSAHIISMDRDD